MNFCLWTNVGCQSIENAKSLHADLLDGYSKLVRPVWNQSDTVGVYFYFSLVAIQDFDEVKEHFSVTGAFFLYWLDQNMNWIPDNYGNIISVLMGYKDVWVPEIILTNPSQKLESYGKLWQLIRYTYNGIATWYPADLMKSTCSLDFRYFPFDVQECSMKLYIWAYTSSEVRLFSFSDDIRTALMEDEHGTWTLLNTSVKTKDDDGIYRATLKFRLERKSLYVIVNIVLPIFILSILNNFVFMLPAESGERVSYAITVLLAIGVFMTIVNDTLPKKSEPLPIISYYLMIDLIQSALTCLFTILNLRIYHKDVGILVPNKLQNVYLSLVKENNERRVSINSINQQNTEFEDDISEKHPNSNLAQLGDGWKNSVEGGKQITWKDISKLIDCVLFILVSLVTFTSLIVVLVVTQYH